MQKPGEPRKHAGRRSMALSSLGEWLLVQAARAASRSVLRDLPGWAPERSGWGGLIASPARLLATVGQGAGVELVVLAQRVIPQQLRPDTGTTGGGPPDPQAT